MRDRTTLFVTHRLTTTRTADSIAVVLAGRCVESGPPWPLPSLNVFFLKRCLALDHNAFHLHGKHSLGVYLGVNFFWGALSGNDQSPNPHFHEHSHTRTG